MSIETSVTRCVCEKIAQNVAQSFICQNLYITLPDEKEVKNFGLQLKISRKLPKENNHPIGLNSPILVTLIETNLLCIF
jgi:hypothetical protein